MFFSITFSQTYFAIFNQTFQYDRIPSLGGEQIYNIYFFFFLFNNRIFYISVNQSLWIKIGLTNILLLAIVYIWFHIIIKPTMHNCEICYDNLLIK